MEGSGEGLYPILSFYQVGSFFSTGEYAKAQKGKLELMSPQKHKYLYILLTTIPPESRTETYIQ